MDNLNKSQRVIIFIIIACMLAVIGYYIMRKTETYDTFNANSALENNNVEAGDPISSNEEIIIIHVAGEVKEPGIVYLKEGDRIADVIEKAGGIKAEADLDKVNLAYEVQDGQKIYIPSKNEKEDNEINIVIEESGENIIIEENGIKTNLININKASQTELEILTGIGPSTALKIIEYRKENGKFKKIEDIMNVPGIGESKFEAIKSSITV